MSHNELFFVSQDRGRDTAVATGARLEAWLIESGWAVAEPIGGELTVPDGVLALAPGPRAYAEGAAVEGQSGRAFVEIDGGLYFPTAGDDVAATCPRCGEEVDMEGMIELLTGLPERTGTGWTAVTCPFCTQKSDYRHWTGDLRPIHGFVALRTDGWTAYEHADGRPSLLQTELAAALGGRWVLVASHR